MNKETKEYYVDTSSRHANWLDIDIKEAEEAGICKFKYV